MLAISAATASVYAAQFCPICDGPMGAGKKMCNKCQEKSDRNTRAMANTLLSGIAKTQQKQQIVDKAAAKLAVLLSDNGISDNKKIEMINSVLKQINAPEFYRAIAANAPLSVVKYYWPDSKNQQVYLLSKKVIDKRQNSGVGGMLAQGLQMLGAQMGTVKQNAPKVNRTAFALGRSKKDDSIRFVDPEGFSYFILYAATNNTPEILQYYIDQMGGSFDWGSRASCISDIMNQRQLELQRKGKLSAKLAAAEKKLKNAEDKFDQNKYQKEIAVLKKELAGIPSEIVLDKAKGKMIFRDATRFEFFLILEDGSYGLQDPMFGGVVKEKRAEAFEDLLKLAVKFCSPKVAGWIKAHSTIAQWNDVKKDKYIFGGKAKVQINNWLAEGKIIKELPCYIYIHDGHHVKWCDGIPHPGKPGYVSGREKGTYAWKSGIPDVTRLGFLSGTKEGEWVAAPGFRKNGNQMQWVPGSKHPSINGLLAGKTPCSWIPDKEHLWNNPDNPGDLSVRKDDNAFLAALKEANSNRR